MPRDPAPANLGQGVPRPGAQPEPDSPEPGCWEPVKLPGTRALFRDGRLRPAKVVIIARAAAVLDADETRQAEEQVLGDAPGLSPGRLRSAIKRAVKRVAPAKAMDRREHGRRTPGWNAGRKTRETPPWPSGKHPGPGAGRGHQ